jgi:hypothetical protein
MLKRSVVVAALAICLSSAASAQTPTAAADPKGGPNDACMKSAYDLADVAESKQLPDATLEKLDGMFNTMEKHCKALELPQAEAKAKEIKALIDTEK